MPTAPTRLLICEGSCNTAEDLATAAALERKAHGCHSDADLRFLRRLRHTPHVWDHPASSPHPKYPRERVWREQWHCVACGGTRFYG
jgi:hypothetical protein